MDTAYLSFIFSTSFPPFPSRRASLREAAYVCVSSTERSDTRAHGRVGSANARGTRANLKRPVHTRSPRFHEHVLASWTRNNSEISRKILSSRLPFGLSVCQPMRMICQSLENDDVIKGNTSGYRKKRLFSFFSSIRCDVAMLLVVKL